MLEERLEVLGGGLLSLGGTSSVDVQGLPLSTSTARRKTRGLESLVIAQALLSMDPMSLRSARSGWLR